MDNHNFELAQSLINPSYIRLAQNSINKRQKIVKELLSQRQLPQHPLDDLTIQFILNTLAIMDSNNFDGKVGVGERQSRIFSKIVAERHFHMGHGIGRSGDIVANQPKAAGSSLMLQLTKYLTVSALHQLNYNFVKDVLPLPLATGMSLTLALLTLHQQQPDKKYVIWSRIDQKTCLKSIGSANLIPIVIQLKQEGDSLGSDLAAIQQKIKQLGSEKVLAVMSTTSCFAPRIPDKVDQIALLVKKYGIYHVINNAYGIWCSKIAHMIKQAYNKGQCTVVVQSTDKNFMVPVGGSFVFCQQPDLLTKISAKYPGRASGSPIVDLFITLLSMGKHSIQQLKAARKSNYEIMYNLGIKFAQKHECRIMKTTSNTISVCMHLSGFKNEENATKLGSILFSKRVMGHRIVASSQKLTKIGQNSFKNYGSHSDSYPFMPYITFACAVGSQKEELQMFFKRLEQSWKQFIKSIKKQEQKKLQLQKPISKSPQQKPQKQKQSQQKSQKEKELQQKQQNKPQETLKEAPPLKKQEESLVKDIK